MKRLSQTATALTLGIALQTANAGENFVRPEPIIIGSLEFQKLCNDTKNKTGLLIDDKEVCEISTNNGETWISLVKFLALGGLLTGAGVSAYMIRRRKTKEDILDEWVLSQEDINQEQPEYRKNKAIEEVLEIEHRFMQLILSKIQTLKKIGQRCMIDGNAIELTKNGYIFTQKEVSIQFHSIYDLYSKYFTEVSALQEMENLKRGESCTIDEKEIIRTGNGLAWDAYILTHAGIATEFRSIDRLCMEILAMYGSYEETVFFLSELDTVESIVRFEELMGEEIGDTWIRIIKNENNEFIFERRVSDGVCKEMKKDDPLIWSETSDIIKKMAFKKVLKAILGMDILKEEEYIDESANITQEQF